MIEYQTRFSNDFDNWTVTKSAKSMCIFKLIHKRGKRRKCFPCCSREWKWKWNISSSLLLEFIDPHQIVSISMSMPMPGLCMMRRMFGNIWKNNKIIKNTEPFCLTSKGREENKNCQTIENVIVFVWTIEKIRRFRFCLISRETKKKKSRRINCFACLIEIDKRRLRWVVCCIWSYEYTWARLTSYSNWISEDESFSNIKFVKFIILPKRDLTFLFQIKFGFSRVLQCSLLFYATWFRHLTCAFMMLSWHASLTSFFFVRELK